MTTKTNANAMMLGEVTLDLVGFTDNIRDFKDTFNHEVPVQSVLEFTLPNGQIVRMDVAEIQEIVWKAYSMEDDIEIFDGDEVR